MFEGDSKHWLHQRYVCATGQAMTSEENDDPFVRDTFDRMTDEECPTLEIPEDRSPRDLTTTAESEPPPSVSEDRQLHASRLADDTPPTLTMGWAAREDDFISVGDTIPEMLIWKVEQEAPPEGDTAAGDTSLRETMRDTQAFERTQIIDMDEVMGFDDAEFLDEEHALTDLAGAVGHELNNPLTTCVGYLRQISDMVSSEDGQMAHMVERLGRNLNRIHSIVGELEMLAAESTERRTRVDLAMVVERVHDQLSGFLDADVELHLRQAHLLADRPRLYQLVYIMLAAHMLDDENEDSFTVRVSSRTVGACLEIVAPHKPQGSLRLDLLGILRRDTLAGSTPLGLAAQLTRTMGGSWFESELHDGHRVTAVLPRRCALTAPKDSK